PNALSAPAFEHMNGGPGVRIQNQFNALHSFPAYVAGPFGSVLRSGNPLSLKYLHGHTAGSSIENIGFVFGFVYGSNRELLRLRRSQFELDADGQAVEAAAFLDGH